jgi:hypothetical protein
MGAQFSHLTISRIKALLAVSYISVMAAIVAARRPQMNGIKRKQYNEINFDSEYRRGGGGGGVMKLAEIIERNEAN